MAARKLLDSQRPRVGGKGGSQEWAELGQIQFLARV